jgi:VIT1/CCC1 family predicted Fe2+/Mn2+ transporter
VTVVPTRVGPPPEPADLHDEAMALEAQITKVVRGAARAAVLGVNDGLVSNVCLILAVAGAALRQLAIVVGASAVTYGVGKLFGTAVS